MRRVGVLGGTFDPVHFGHLRPGVEAAAALALDELRLVPARVSPLRDAPAAAGEHRLEMLRHAVDGSDDLVVDRRELDRAGPSYTADTLAELGAELPDARLFVVMGADAFTTFDRWGRWAEILERAHLVVLHRPGTALEAPAPVRPALAVDVGELHAAAAGRVWVQAVTQLDISATRIRQLAAAGGDLRFLLPDATRRYLEEQRLYDAR